MEFVNVSKSFNENLILDNINLKIDKSGLYVIVGESGVGKTTLLNLMAKKIEPDNGNIIYDDLTYMSSDCKLVEILNVYDNLYLISNDKEKILRYINYFNLRALKRKKVSKLSCGERQRVCIIMNLLSNSNILLLDEPTSNLDVETSKLVYELLKKESLERIIIVVSHDVGNIVDYADCVYNIKDKKIEELRHNIHGNDVKKVCNQINTKGLLKYSIKTNKYNLVISKVSYIVWMLLGFLVSAFFCFVLTNNKKNFDIFCENSKIDFCEYHNNDYSNIVDYKKESGFVEITRQHFNVLKTEMVLDSVYYEDVCNDISIPELKNDNDCIITKKTVDYIYKVDKVKIIKGTVLSHNISIGYNYYKQDFVVSNIVDTYNSFNNLSDPIIISKRNYDVSDKLVYSGFRPDLGKGIEDLPFDFRRWIRNSEFLESSRNYQMKSIDEIDENYCGYFYIGQLPTQNDELMISDLRNYLVMDKSYLNNKIVEKNVDINQLKDYSISNQIEGNFYYNLEIDKKSKINKINVTGYVGYINCGVISRVDFNIIPDTLYDLYTHNKHIDGFYVNTYGDLFYIPFKMIKNGYDFVMNVDERTFLGIIKNCFVTDGLIKGFGMFVIYSLGIYVIIDVIYKHLLFINVNKDYDLLKNYGLNAKGIRRSSCLINFWNVLFAILGIILGIIFVKKWYYNKTKSISNVPFGANYPLSIIVSILSIVLLACLSGLIFAWKVGRNNENSIE